MSDIKTNPPAQLKGLDTYSKLLDTRFRIPGTSIRFGIDFIVGLIPFGGDILSFLFSAGLVLTMARHGVSGMVIGRMLWNVFLDTTVGSIPLAGDVFDLFYKANRRNYELLEKHYGEGAYQGSIWRIIIPVLIALVLIFILCIWLMVKLVAWSWELVS